VDSGLKHGKESGFLADGDATKALGRFLGQHAFPGCVIALKGDLGSGKTTFTQGFCEGIGVADLSQVSSPTFVLHQQYQGRLEVHHFDVYRLKNLEEFWDLGPGEYLQGDGVALIEWADRVEPLLPDDRLQIELSHQTSGRKYTLSALGPRHEQWLKALPDWGNP